MRRIPVPMLALSMALLSVQPIYAQDADPVFSGPQAGEKLAPFTIRGVLADLADKDLDLVSQAGDRPLVIVFVHKLTRPSIGLTRTVLNYAKKMKADAGLVFLSDDATATKATIKRAAHALPKVSVGISKDGAAGPGAYGLNRNVTLTVLVGKAGKVTANFALVQPSQQADARRIGRQIALATGQDLRPTLADMGVQPRYNKGRMQQDLRPLLSPLIQKSASEAEVKKAAEKIEAFAAKNAAGRKQIGDIARRIIKAGVLERYGTPAAQDYLRKWSKTFDPPKKPADEDDGPATGRDDKSKPKRPEAKSQPQPQPQPESRPKRTSGS